jgi:hypothetical protein
MNDKKNYIVKLKPEFCPDPDGMRQLRDNHISVLIDRKRHGNYGIHNIDGGFLVSCEKNIEHLISEIRKLPFVASVEPQKPITPDYLPEDRDAADFLHHTVGLSVSATDSSFPNISVIKNCISEVPSIMRNIEIQQASEKPTCHLYNKILRNTALQCDLFSDGFLQKGWLTEDQLAAAIPTDKITPAVLAFLEKNNFDCLLKLTRKAQDKKEQQARFQKAYRAMMTSAPKPPR